LCILLQSAVTSSLLGPTILLGTLFPYTLSLCSFFNARDKSFSPLQNHRQNCFVYSTRNFYANSEHEQCSLVFVTMNKLVEEKANLSKSYFWNRFSHWIKLAVFSL
jgi:hypothetical protein